jgi:hypothetical protein
MRKRENSYNIYEEAYELAKLGQGILYPKLEKKLARFVLQTSMSAQKILNSVFLTFSVQ